ncbi:MAG TPA: 6-bladed beta-propeller [Planctomycetia bacterium]|nr:6-bladed beta-propeller [Planctomycetia bacterium]
METNRRQFLAAAGAIVAAPAIATARKSDSKIVTGSGDHKFEVQHDWAKLPSEFKWQTTHNVAVDEANNLYVIHEGRENLKDHPNIFVFDKDGNYVRSFGQQFQGGGHGIEVRKEGSEEFLYVCAYQNVKAFAKLSLKGDVVWLKHAPAESKVYAPEESTAPKKVWGRNRFLPTNFAFLDDGGFLLADGYGSFYIHRYDKDGKWVSAFGGPGKGEGTFNTPHGIWIDRRPGREQQICVCDRANNTLQYFTLDGKYVETIKGFGLPANLDTWKDLLLVPELVARVTLLDSKNQVAAYLGEDVERIKADPKHAIRGDSKKWVAGKFVHPHDACFDPAGNIYVAEWVATGRITRLKRL